MTEKSNRALLDMKHAQDFFIEHLPFHLRPDFQSCYAHKLYPWQKDFILNRNPLAFLTAANQVGKSSGSLLRCINQAVRKDLWSYWFPKIKPKTFLYLYPEAKLANAEFHEKWEKTYLSRGRMKDDLRYGWKENKEKGFIESIRFASGVTVYFRNYTQSPVSLQAITADAVFLDEETPEAHYSELLVRSQARQALGSGYVSMVFTATLGQTYLYNCMEMRGTDKETFIGAWKRQISAFDCMTYCDGSPSQIWTEKYINELLPRYATDSEVQKRIYGRFIKTSGLVYGEFDYARNTELLGDTDTTGWEIWVGIDFGSGGDHGHSSSIAFVAISPDYTQARVVRSWSSKKVRMTQGDLLERYKEMSAGISHQVHADWAATDFFELAARESLPINKAEKSHEIGVGLMNTLFKTGALKVCLGEGTGDNSDIPSECRSINEDTPKRKRVDDMTDAVRYAISLCPMRISQDPKPEKKPEEKLNPRMAFYRGLDRKDDPMMHFDDEFQEAIDDAYQMFEDI